LLLLWEVVLITDQTNRKKIAESFAKQNFQRFSWFGFGREVL